MLGEARSWLDIGVFPGRLSIVCNLTTVKKAPVKKIAKKVVAKKVVAKKAVKRLRI